MAVTKNTKLTFEDGETIEYETDDRITRIWASDIRKDSSPHLVTCSDYILDGNVLRKVVAVDSRITDEVEMAKAD